jgi:uncharacterized phage protein (TIGR01671 family)
MTPSRFRFRAWDKHHKMMYLPEHIASVNNDNDDDILGCINLSGCWGAHLAGHYARPMDTVVLMQSTGLADKEGKEIFEGDVIALQPKDERTTSSWDYARFTVKWNTEHAMFQFMEWNRGWSPAFDMDTHQPLVIGNIYENPELIK